MDATRFERHPREYALELIDNGLVTAEHLAMCLVNYMNADEVRRCLDKNDLSPDGFRRNMEG